MTVSLKTPPSVKEKCLDNCFRSECIWIQVLPCVSAIWFPPFVVRLYLQHCSVYSKLVYVLTKEFSIPFILEMEPL